MGGVLGKSFAVIKDLGLCDYEQSLKVQNEFHEKVRCKEIASALIVVEHPAVLTLGKSSSEEYIGDLSAQAQVKVIRTDRGGEVTAHMPGQLVFYPIIPVQDWGISPRAYVEKLEQSVINLLDKYLLEGKRDPINPGIWLGEDKVCAIGIRIKNRVSLHGMALNVDNDLGLFGDIVPCGIKGRGVTRLLDQTNKGLNKDTIKTQWIDCLEATFC
jgi:lipoate-protein ligase B